jgi:hypothetical protein
VPEMNPKPENNLVESDRLGFTTVAGGASGAVAVIALLTAVLDWLEGVTVNENIKIALIGLAGAGFLAWAIASTGDVLARAYAAAHVVNTDPKTTQTSQPALQAAADKLEPKLGELLKAYNAAHPSAPPAPPASPDQGITVFSLPAPLDILVNADSGQAIAVRVQADGKVRYLVGIKGQRLRWEDEAAVTVKR